MFGRRTVVLAVMLVAACSADVSADQGSSSAAANRGQAASPNGDNGIIYVDADDAEMNGAKQRARAALPQFYARLADPADDESEFMIKFDIVPGEEEAEFVWAGQLDRSASPMTGVLVNQPELTDHRVGQRVAIPEVDIIDWSYVKGGTMQGDFTDRVLIDRMPSAEAAHERSLRGW